MVRAAITLFLAVCSFIACAQAPQPSFTVFDVEDGLPSSEVYDGLQDRDGYLWFATDRGVVRFNGYEFTTYTTKDGLDDNVVFELYEDYQGRIWGLSIIGDLSYFNKGRIVHYQYNQAMKEILPSHKYSYSFFVDTLDNVHFGTAGNGMAIISKDGVVKRIQRNKAGDNIYFEQYAGQWCSYRSIMPGGSDSSSYSFKDHVIVKTSQYSHSPLVRSEVFNVGDNLICFNQANSVVLFNTTSLEILDSRSYATRISSLSGSSSGEVFVGLAANGMHVLEVEDGKLVERHWVLKNLTVSGCFRDMNGGYWVTSTQRGIYYTPNLDILSYTQANGLAHNFIEELRVNSGTIALSHGDTMQLLGKGGLSEPVGMTIPEHSIVEGNRGRLHVHGCDLLAGNRKLLDVCTGFLYPYRGSAGMAAVKMEEDGAYIFTRGYGYRYSDKGFAEVPIQGHVGRIEDVEIIDEHTFWIGSDQGLFLQVDGELTEMAARDTLFGHRVVDLDRSEHFDLVVASRGAGVILLKGDSIITINTDKGLIDNDVTCVHVDSLQNIWVATNRGLNKLDAVNPLKIEYFSTNDGLVSNEITSLRSIGNQIYVGTKKGLSVIDVDAHVRDTAVIDLRIVTVMLDGSPVDHKEAINVYPRNDFLEISYLGLNYRARGQIAYRYRINGLSNEWHYTRTREIIMQSFPEQGAYTIEIMARQLPYGEWTEKPIVVSFVIHPPFYKTWWFLISMLTLTGLLIYLAFKVNIIAYNKHIQQEIANRILRKLGRKSYLIIEIDKKEIRINEAAILFVQAFKDYVEIHTSENKFLYRCSMKSIEEKLQSGDFIRVHRSYLVKIDKIDSISKDGLAIEEHEIPIGVTYQPRLKGLKEQFSLLNR